MKNRNIYAQTLPTTFDGYTGYISVNEEGNDTISFSVRSHHSKNGDADLIVLLKKDAHELCLALLQRTSCKIRQPEDFICSRHDGHDGLCACHPIL